MGLNSAALLSVIIEMCFIIQMMHSNKENQGMNLRQHAGSCASQALFNAPVSQ